MYREPQQTHISKAERGWQKTCLQERFPSASCLAMTTRLWQQLSVWQCTCCTLQTKRSSHLSLPKLRLKHQTPYLHPNLAPNLLHTLDDQLSLSDSTQASDGAVQSLAGGREPAHYPGLLPPQGCVHHFAEWHTQAF